MRLPVPYYQISDELKQRFPNLSESQSKGLTMWVVGAILGESGCQSSVAANLAESEGEIDSVRQRLREWLYDGEDRARPCGTSLNVEECFAPLLRWILSTWKSDSLALALDPTLKNDNLAAIVVSAVYRGGAIPVAWHIVEANRKGKWMEPAAALLRTLADAVPDHMKVLVLCDRGLRSPLLWDQICELGWHPIVRQGKNTVFRPDRGIIGKATELVSAPGHTWIGAGSAFRAKKIQRRATMMVSWVEGQDDPWVLLTDLPPKKVAPSWYSMRFWIEEGFRDLKSMGWQWQRTRRTDPVRAARHWLALAAATLLTVLYGTRVEDAGILGKSPGNHRAPKSVSSNGRGIFCGWKRKTRVFRLGIIWLRRLLYKGRLWKMVWLLPEPWPESPPTMEVTYG